MTESAACDATTARILVIRNPAAGGRRRRRFEATMAHLRQAGCRIEICDTKARGEGMALARDACGKGFDRIVAAGGDGTINEVINGLAPRPPDDAMPPGGPPPLAVLPLGTANVLAAEIELPNEPAALAKIIVHGPARRIGLARLGSGAYFAAMAGAGFDAHIVAGVDTGLKRLIGKGAYAWEGLRQLFVFPFPEYRVTVDGQAFDAAWVIVTRGRYFAGRFLIAPHASLQDELLHVCLFRRRGVWAMLRYGLAMQFGRLGKLADYRVVSGRRVDVDGPPGDPLEADGDLVASLPVSIELVPEALDLVMPDRN